MREVKIGVCLLIGLLLVMPAILAINTEVNIKTMPFRNVQVAASKADSVSFSLYQRFTEKSDEYGDVKFIFNFSALKYNLDVYIKEEEITIAKDRQLGLVTGDSQYFEIAISGFEFIDTPNTPKTAEVVNTNETSEINDTEVADSGEDEEVTPDETTETENLESNSSLSKIAGAVVSKVKENKSFVTYGIIGIVIIGGMIFLFRKRRSSGEIKVGSVSSDKANAEANRQEILDVEDKLKQIQDKLDSLS